MKSVHTKRRCCCQTQQPELATQQHYSLLSVMQHRIATDR